ncbi:hypothetical protein B0H17DRAFT_1204495 [Mycena rosella]|uniref:Uncharacterized protein n=1 Tax=Mycena rosella TaxID=1033263 RepID=A0AAD7GB71_MYCRO|nr:hypothetical protein B0H17DRAFT_1204495 [Mycena rosella]
MAHEERVVRALWGAGALGRGAGVRGGRVGGTLALCGLGAYFPLASDHWDDVAVALRVPTRVQPDASVAPSTPRPNPNPSRACPHATRRVDPPVDTPPKPKALVRPPSCNATRRSARQRPAQTRSPGEPTPVQPDALMHLSTHRSNPKPSCNPTQSPRAPARVQPDAPSRPSMPRQSRRNPKPLPPSLTHQTPVRRPR